MTGDDSDNEVLALPDAPRFNGRDANPFAPRDQARNNPRRNNPVRRAPSFARSDGSFLGPAGAPPVIDLTEDDAHEEASPPPAPPRAFPHRLPGRDGLVDRVLRAEALRTANMNALFRQIGMPDLLHNMRIALGGGQGEAEVQFIGENLRPDHPFAAAAAANFPALENPLADNPVEFNYGANGFGGINDHQPPAAARPKPVHIAPPAARDGFTRDTGEETVVVCPSCGEELEYDPDDENGGRPPPAKRARTTTRKDREEHHFWAVKACGHVSFCRLSLPVNVSAHWY